MQGARKEDAAKDESLIDGFSDNELEA